MKTIIIFAVIIAASFADKKCTGVYIDNRYYDLTVIKEGVNKLSALELNRRDNLLYFIFEDLSETPIRLLGCLDLNTNNASIINGIRNATSITIDHRHHKVYVGGADGLFKINENNTAEQLPVQGYVRDVFFKDILYFSNSNNELYKFEDGYIFQIQEVRGVEVEKFIFDNDNNIFYTKGKDLFRVRLGTRAVHEHELIKANVLVTDIYFKAFACTNDGLYKYNKFKFVFDKVADLPGLKAITFNSYNEPTYTIYDKLIELKLSSIGCFDDL